MPSERFPEGHYKARAVDAKLGYTSNGNDQLAIEFELQEEYKGERITKYLFFTDKAWERTKESLEHMGFGGDFNHLETLYTKEVTLVIGPNDKGFSEVRFINGPRRAALKSPMNDEQHRGFAARMNAKFGAKVSAAPNTTAPVTPKPADDIPF